jgi:poly(A) polymerase
MGPSTPTRSSDAPSPADHDRLEPDVDLADEDSFADAPTSSGVVPSDPSSLLLVGADPESSSMRRYQVAFEQSFIDPDVRKVLRRLVRYGHEAYLVGGCVRDLLLSRRPKDFDVATSAHPEEVRALFRNSRIIGRRFRLVHVMFHGRKVIEVATFRRNPRDSSDGELIRNDNVFGTADEDAVRRDFTINALFYELEHGHIIDWVGGMHDIRRRLVRTIGDPETRFREDPVRILRAVKFSGRLDLGIDPQVYDAIVSCREMLQLAARPRVAEEILRLLRGGQARRSIYIAWETGLLDVLLPELAALLYDAEGDDTPGARVWRQLGYIDRRHEEGDTLDDTVLWTLLLLEAMKEACDGQRDRAGAVSDYLEHLIERLAITRRSADGMRRIVASLPKVLAGRPGRIARSETFPLVLDVAEADLLSSGSSARAIAKMRDAYASRKKDEARRG